MKVKHFLSWVLIVLFGCHSALFALAFDKTKLMALDPPCSQRVECQSNAFQNDRLWANLGLGLALLGVIWNNSGDLNADAKLGNLTQGFTLLSTGAILYSADGDPVVQNDTLQQLDLSGTEEEVVAYSILKYNAARNQVNRINSGRILVLTGLGYALLSLLATTASHSYKDVMYISAVVFFAQGVWLLNNPGQNEKDMVKIDMQVGAN